MCDFGEVFDSIKNLSEQEGEEHKRLRKELKIWANKMGYNNDGPSFKEIYPDSVFVNQDKQKLFVGDAKDASNENPDNKETGDRIRKYLSKFLSFLQNGKYKEGIFAILTNDQKVAEKWRLFLNKISSNEKMNFKNEEIKPGKTWIVWSFCPQCDARKTEG